MQLDFYEVVGDLLGKYKVSIAQLAAMVPEKATLVPKWASGERVPAPKDLDLLRAALSPSQEEFKALEAARKYSALKEMLSKHKLSLSKAAIDEQLRILKTVTV